MAQDLDKTSLFDWIKRRVKAVDEVFTAFNALSEAGIDLIDPATDLQIPCPLSGHGHFILRTLISMSSDNVNSLSRAVRVFRDEKGLTPSEMKTVIDLAKVKHIMEDDLEGDEEDKLLTIVDFHIRIRDKSSWFFL